MDDERFSIIKQKYQDISSSIGGKDKEALVKQTQFTRPILAESTTSLLFMCEELIRMVEAPKGIDSSIAKTIEQTISESLISK